MTVEKAEDKFINQLLCIKSSSNPNLGDQYPGGRAGGRGGGRAGGRALEVVVVSVGRGGPGGRLGNGG